MRRKPAHRAMLMTCIRPACAAGTRRLKVSEHWASQAAWLIHVHPAKAAKTAMYR